MSEVRATDIDTLCSERGWSRPRLIQELRKSAAVLGVELRADDENLARMIRAWNSGKRGLSGSNAALLSKVFGVQFVAGRSVSSTPDVTRRNMLSAAAVVAASARQSSALIERLASTVDPLAVEQFAAETERLAIDYIGNPPLDIAQEAKQLRDSVMVALERTRRPSQIRDLYLLSSRLSGILAYAAMDLGNATAAMANARSSLLCADLAGHNSLMAWGRGTQSLIARFANKHREAEKYIEAGLALRSRGATLARLFAGQAQCRAHFADTNTTFDAIALAFKAHSEGEHDADEVGVFGFPRSKVHYYAASSLIWLPDNNSARRATVEATTAIQLFRQGPVEDRFVTDEILAHIYSATGHIQQGEVGAASATLKSILDTPTEQRTSWHRKRLARLTTLLNEPRYRNSRQATELQSQLRVF